VYKPTRGNPVVTLHSAMQTKKSLEIKQKSRTKCCLPTIMPKDIQLARRIRGERA